MLNVQYEPYYDKWFILKEDFYFEFTLNELYDGRPDLVKVMADKTGVKGTDPLVIIAPKGMVTDMASIPAIFQKFGIKPDGPWKEGAVLHDLLYQKKSTAVAYLSDKLSKLTLHSNKDFADRMFLMVMRKAGVGIVTRKAMYEAVVRYGWGSYVDPNADATYPIPDNVQFKPVRNYLFFRSIVEQAVPPVGDEEGELLANVLFPNIKRMFLNQVI